MKLFSDSIPASIRGVKIITTTSKISNKRRLFLSASSVTLGAISTAGCGSGADFAEVSDEIANSVELDSTITDKGFSAVSKGFRNRREQAFSELKDTKLEFSYISPNPYYIRPQSWDRLSFALAMFWNETNLDEANNAIVDHNNSYLDAKYGERRMFEGDSFYWAIGLLFECIELFGSQGTRRKGLLKAEVEESCYPMLLKYADRMSNKAAYSTQTVWEIWHSENHHMQLAFCLWHTAKLLNDHDRYQKQPLADGQLPIAHLQGWTSWLKAWIREHASKGLMVEYGNDFYNATTLKGLYVAAAFTRDSELKTLAVSFIEVFFASWLQDHMKGKSTSGTRSFVKRGGGKCRVYPNQVISREVSPIANLCWFYAGVGEKPKFSNDTMMMAALDIEPHFRIIARLNEWSIPTPYEVKDRTLGLYDPTRFKDRTPLLYPIDVKSPFIRYTYKTQTFVMGSTQIPPKREWEWTMISSQNRVASVTFDSALDSECAIFASPTDDRMSYNSFWSVQKGAALIAQKFKVGTNFTDRFSHKTGTLRVWVSTVGQTKSETKGNWFFYQYGSSWLAIGFPDGGADIEQVPSKSGFWLSPKQEYAPVVLQASNSSQVESFDEFIKKMLSSQLSLNQTFCEYKSLSNDLLNLPLNWTGGPLINGESIDYSPSKLMDGPYLESEFGSPKVLYKRYRTRIEYDFSAASRRVYSIT